MPKVKFKPKRKKKSRAIVNLNFIVNLPFKDLLFMLFQNLRHDFGTLEIEAEAYTKLILIAQHFPAKVKLPLNVIFVSSPSFG